MNALKRSLVMLALAAGISAPAAFAQPPADHPPGEHGERGGSGMRGDRVKQLTEALGLTEEQVAKIKPIVAEEGAAMKAIFDDKSLERDARREKLKAVRESFAPKYEAILTPEQKAKFEKMKSMRGPGGPRADRKGEDKK